MTTNTYTTAHHPDGFVTTVLLAKTRVIDGVQVDRIMYFSKQHRDAFVWASECEQYVTATQAEYLAERATAVKAGDL